MFPLKETDQRVYGFYDNQAITRLRADAYGDTLNDTQFQDVLNMPLPEQPDELLRQPPKGSGHFAMFASCNVTFDETMFPLKETDQR
eukprot:814814-Rhodomonas_salina.1